MRPDLDTLCLQWERQRQYLKRLLEACYDPPRLMVMLPEDAEAIRAAIRLADQYVADAAERG